ncbi:MAG: helix-turn-helix domain-containing protein [Candidatus Woesearchaeota archaeon]|jgi:sugar-specific transcriptional regulator TrmB
MDVLVISQELEQIGLNKSEIKVYLSLLKLGASTTGPIINDSKTANSKIYEVLEKLIQKGLVSYFTKENVKHYKATNPNMLKEYLNEKAEKIEKEKEKLAKLLPLLMSFSQEKEEEKEAVIFSGSRGVKTAFTNLVDELNPDEEVHIMGVYDFGKSFMNSAIYFQKIRSNKKIKAKFLINPEAKHIANEFEKYPPVEIRYLPKGTFTPAIFLIYKDKVIINIAKEMTFFVLKSKSAKETFDAYFNLMWTTAKKS